jgi:hypothetical protein
MIKNYTLILVYCISFTFGLSNNYPEKRYQTSAMIPADIAGRDDRKYADQSGNRVLCRFYNQGSIGDQSSSFSGVYPIGSGHAYIWEFSPIVAASVIDTNGNRKRIISDGIRGLVDDSPEGTPWSFEPLAGYANPNQEYLAMSDNSGSWPSSWPNRPDDWSGEWN